MTRDERQELREAALAAKRAVSDRARDNSGRLPGDWELQTSNSHRRIGAHGDGDVLCAVTQRSDNHPDLHASPDVLKYIVAAQPSAVLALLDQLDAAEKLLSKLSEVEARLLVLDENNRKFDENNRKFLEAQEARFDAQEARFDALDEADRKLHEAKDGQIRALSDKLDATEKLIPALRDKLVAAEKLIEQLQRVTKVGLA